VRFLNSRAGITITEAIVATGILSLLMAGGAALLVGASSYGLRGFEQSIAESDINLAMQKISKSLRISMEISIDQDGNGITYYWPIKDNNGNYIIPLMADGGHRFYLSGTRLLSSDYSRPVLEDVVTTDPLTGSSYRLFSDEPVVSGVRVVGIKVVVSRSFGRGTVYACLKERVLVRNFLP